MSTDNDATHVYFSQFSVVPPSSEGRFSDANDQVHSCTIQDSPVNASTSLQQQITAKVGKHAGIHINIHCQVRVITDSKFTTIHAGAICAGPSSLT